MSLLPDSTRRNSRTSFNHDGGTPFASCEPEAPPSSVLLDIVSFRRLAVLLGVQRDHPFLSVNDYRGWRDNRFFRIQEFILRIPFVINNRCIFCIVICGI